MIIQELLVNLLKKKDLIKLTAINGDLKGELIIISF